MKTQAKNTNTNLPIWIQKIKQLPKNIFRKEVFRSFLNKLFTMEGFAVVLFASMFLYMFWIRPIVSVADNGDFARVMFPAGLFKFDDVFWETAQIKYGIQPTIFGGNGYITSHTICVYVARFFNIIFHSPFVFDIRFLSLIYCTATLIGIYYIVQTLKQKSKIFNLFMIGLLWFILCDGGYIPYLNSLYGEGCSYSFLIMSIGVSLKVITKPSSKKDIALLFVALIMFFASKLQYTLLSPLALLILIPLYRHKKITKIQLRKGLLILLIFNVVVYAVAPKGLSDDTMYQSVYYGILKNSPDVHKDAQALGIPQEYEYLAGTTAYEDSLYTKKDPDFMNHFKTLGRGTVISYYLTHPDRFLQKMDLSTEKAFANLQGMFKNFTEEDGIGRNRFFTEYDKIKAEYFPQKFITLVLIYLVYLLVLVITYFKNKKNLKLWLLFMIGCIGVCQFPLPILGNGEADISKQLFIFNLTFDIMLITAIYYILKQIGSVFAHLIGKLKKKTV